MSIHVIARVLPKRWGSPTRKIVAIKLADVAREDGSHIYPSIAIIASEAELSERQVQRVLGEFRAQGLLRVVRKGGGRRRTTEYRLDLEAVDQLPDAKPSTHEREDVSSAKGDSLSPFNRERVTLTPLKGDTVSPDPSLPVNVPYGENSSASDEAGAEAPSVNAQIWKEGLVLLQSTSLPEAQCRKLIGRWCKRAPSEENKRRLLGILRAAHRAGTGDPVAYVTRALSEALPPPPDPKAFTTDDWTIRLQAAINTKQWSPAWGAPPGKRGCLVPASLLTPELIRALSAAAPQRTARAQTVDSPIHGELSLHGNG